MSSIQNGDILLNNGVIFGRNGDLAHGDGTEQIVGAILNASPGNFRRYPTLGANLARQINGPLNTRDIVARVQNSLRLDGWRLEELNIETEQDELTITLIEAVKVTDNTSSLV